MTFSGDLVNSVEDTILLRANAASQRNGRASLLATIFLVVLDNAYDSEVQLIRLR
jgi:hypothetical protein